MGNRVFRILRDFLGGRPGTRNPAEVGMLATILGFFRSPGNRTGEREPNRANAKPGGGGPGGGPTAI